VSPEEHIILSLQSLQAFGGEVMSSSFKFKSTIAKDNGAAPASTTGATKVSSIGFSPSTRTPGSLTTAAASPVVKATAMATKPAPRLPTTDAKASNMAGGVTRSKSPPKPPAPPSRAGGLKPPESPASPKEEDIQKITAWQTDMDALEETQMKIQQDQMNLVHSQIHILMRELGDLQKQVTLLTMKVDDDVTNLRNDLETAQEEAHSALRLELAEHGNNAAEMKAAWEEAHQSLSRAMDDGLSSMADQHAKALQDHADGHSASLAEMQDKLSRDLQGVADDHARSLADMNDAHHEKHAQNSEALESGLNTVLESAHGKLQEELDTLRHGGAGSLKEMSKILADVTEQVDNLDQALEKEHSLRMAVEQKLDEMCADLRTELQTSFAESHAALKLELAEQSGNQEAIKAAMEEAHAAIRGEMESSHNQLFDNIEEHKLSNVEKHNAMNELLDSMNDAHHEKHAQNSEALESGLQNVLESAHGKLQDELQQLRHGGAGSLKDMSKILADVTEQVDNLDQALEKEHELRLAVEAKLDDMCDNLRTELECTFKEAHSALKLELAEASGNTEAVKAAMEEANAAMAEEWKASHAKLAADLDNHKSENEDKHQNALDAMAAMNDEHHEKHSQNSAKLEEGLEKVLGGAHSKLQEELGMLKSGSATNIKDLSKILADVTQQVDKIDQAVEQEHELRMAVEEKLDSMFNEQDKTIEAVKKDLQVALKESHAALKVELAEHGKSKDEIAAALQDANDALKEEMNLSKNQWKKEIDSHVKANEDKHKDMAKAMKAMDDAHHEKHAANSEKLENSISDALGSVHARLQDEVKQLKSGGAGSLKDLSKIVADMALQIDKVDMAVEKEHELRMAVETKLDQMFNDQDKVITDVKKDLQIALKESHAALKVELAEHGNSKEELRQAMEDANAALKEEVKLSQNTFKKGIDDHVKATEIKHRDIGLAMKAMDDAHHEKHAQNSEKLEASISNVLGGAHAKLQDEIKLLKSGGAGSIKDLSKVLADVAAQVDKIDQAVEKEHELRMAVEDKLDSMFNDQDKTIQDVKKDLQVALKESHAALRVELAEHGKSKDDIKAALDDAQLAMKEELKLSHSALKGELNTHIKNNDALHKSNADAMKAMDDAHHEKHAANSEKLENSISSALGSVHGKLQDELKLLKSGGAGSLKDLSKILADVTQQVDKIDQAVEKEHELRMAVETKLDAMFNDQDKVVQGVKKELQVAMKESHAALKLELAEHGKSKEEMAAAMADAHAALKDELSLHKQGLENHGKVSAGKMAELEAQLRKDLKKVADDHGDKLQAFADEHGEKHEQHAQNAKALEAGLHNALASTHSKLQADLAALQNGTAGNHVSLKDILTDVTKQVDELAKDLDKEHDMRMAVEGKLDKMCEDLRKESDVALKEAHAALRVELAAQSKDANEMKAAMAEAHKSLKAEYGWAHGDMGNKLDEHGKKHAMTLAEMQKELKRDLQATAGDVDAKHRELNAKHAKHQEGIDQRFSLLETASMDKHAHTFKELQATNAKIQELQGLLGGHRSKTDLTHSSLEERIGYLERQLKERAEATNNLQGQVRGESLTREKNSTALESKLSKLETGLIEITDRQQKEMENVLGRMREAIVKVDQQKSIFDNTTNMLESRLTHLDRAVLESSDSHSRALSAFHADYGKEMTHLLHAERVAREAQEKTFLDYIQDARQQKDALEATVQEQLRLERVAREVQASQLKDALSHQSHFGASSEYTDILLQERQSREATERTLERRLESFERAISMERHERAQELQRIWDAFDGHTHEAMSPIVQQVPQVSTRSIMAAPRVNTTISPRTIATAPMVERIVEQVIEAKPIGSPGYPVQVLTSR